MATQVNGETQENVFAMNPQSVVSQFCNKIFAENHNQLKEDLRQPENLGIFDAQSDEEIGNRLIRCLRQGRLSLFTVALLELRENFTRGKALIQDDDQIAEEALEILEDTLSLLELVDFTVGNNKDNIPVTIIQNIGRLFRRLSMGLSHLVSCSETAMKQKQLEAVRLDKQILNIMRWVVDKAKVMSLKLVEIIGRRTLSTYLSFPKLQQATSSNRVKEATLLSVPTKCATNNL